MIREACAYIVEARVKPIAADVLRAASMSLSAKCVKCHLFHSPITAYGTDEQVSVPPLNATEALLLKHFHKLLKILPSVVFHRKYMTKVMYL